MTKEERDRLRHLRSEAVHAWNLEPVVVVPIFESRLQMRQNLAECLVAEWNAMPGLLDQIDAIEEERANDAEMLEGMKEGISLRIADLEAERDAARAVLRQVEWAGSTMDNDDCPCCYRRGAHVTDCALAAALGGRR